MTSPLMADRPEDRVARATGRPCDGSPVLVALLDEAEAHASELERVSIR